MTLPPPRSLLVPALGAVVVLVVALLVRQGVPGTGSMAGMRMGSGAGSGSGGGSGVVHTGRVTVPITDYAFVPKTITVRAGTRVTWTNHDATAHSATADSGAFDTGTIGPHRSRTLVLRRPGTYAYHCVFHAFMTATVRVLR